jgi:hypothetical protein
MLNMNGLWPQAAANGGADNGASDPWGLGTVLETQARLWNHLLDANRSVWELYMPWLAAGPSLWTAPFAPLQQGAEEVAQQEAATNLGVPDVMEAQARSWNQFLDANRSFWTAFGWPIPLAGDAFGVGAAREAAESAAAATRSAARKRSGGGARAR